MKQTSTVVSYQYTCTVGIQTRAQYTHRWLHPTYQGGEICTKYILRSFLNTV